MVIAGNLANLFQQDSKKILIEPLLGDRIYCLITQKDYLFTEQQLCARHDVKSIG